VLPIDSTKQNLSALTSHKQVENRASTPVDSPSPFAPDSISSLDASPSISDDEDSLYDEDSDEDSLSSSVLAYNPFRTNASSICNAAPDLIKELDPG
jgi:hypothetical protein